MDERKYKKMKFKVFILTLLVIGLVAYIVYDKKLYNYLPIKKDNKENQEIDQSININLDEITILVKDYFYEKNMIKEDNFVRWNITSSEYLGYYEDNKNLKYYQVQGTVSCKDQTSSCISISTDDSKEKKEVFFFETYVTINDDESNKNVESVNQILNESDKLIKINKSVPDDTKNKEKIKKLIKNHYSINNLTNQDNLNTWDIKSVQYVKKQNDLTYYEISGNFTCKDNSSSCITFDQIDTLTNNSYPFDIIVEVKEKSDLFTIISIKSNIYHNKSATIKKEELISLLKDYTKASNLMNESNLASWDIATVTYMGYNKETENNKIYNLKGVYSCNDLSETCLTLKRPGVKRSDNSYPYSIYMEVQYENDKATVISISEDITTGNNFVSFNETIN